MRRNPEKLPQPRVLPRLLPRLPSTALPKPNPTARAQPTRHPAAREKKRRWNMPHTAKQGRGGTSHVPASFRSRQAPSLLARHPDAAASTMLTMRSMPPLDSQPRPDGAPRASVIIMRHTRAQQQQQPSFCQRDLGSAPFFASSSPPAIDNDLLFPAMCRK